MPYHISIFTYFFSDFCDHDQGDFTRTAIKHKLLRPFQGQTFSRIIPQTCPQLSSFYTHLLAYEDGTECPETSAYKIQTPGNYPKQSIQHSEHSESLKSRINYQILQVIPLDDMLLISSSLFGCKMSGYVLLKKG